MKISFNKCQDVVSLLGLQGTDIMMQSGAQKIYWGKYLQWIKKEGSQRDPDNDACQTTKGREGEQAG